MPDQPPLDERLTEVFPDANKFQPDPFRERVLHVLATADLQRWTLEELTVYSNRHMAEMMYGQQADAVIQLFQELQTEEEK